MHWFCGNLQLSHPLMTAIFGIQQTRSVFSGINLATTRHRLVVRFRNQLLIMANHFTARQISIPSLPHSLSPRASLPTSLPHFKDTKNVTFLWIYATGLSEGLPCDSYLPHITKGHDQSRNYEGEMGISDGCVGSSIYTYGQAGRAPGRHVGYEERWEGGDLPVCIWGRVNLGINDVDAEESKFIHVRARTFVHSRCQIMAQQYNHDNMACWACKTDLWPRGRSSQKLSGVYILCLIE